MHMVVGWGTVVSRRNGHHFKVRGKGAGILRGILTSSAQKGFDSQTQSHREERGIGVLENDS